MIVTPHALRAHLIRTLGHLCSPILALRRVTVDIVRTSVIPLRVESTLWLKRPVHVQHTVTHRWLPQSVHVLN